ncbi:methyltransferase family protein [Chromohalobacter marismortui]|uniref:Methyltransferase family protein n=1 Tax=Chromohalobacter marismortui TaxID=42055 RepID=A0A4R7NUL3_9GAMM|nr:MULTISPECIES: class I SAM-dependent methyltransferase [Chromohalobacter]MCI0510726.1 class I SAM-dependent methyltransferase [Chromohalobacter sp.]MCI0593952.1 class I SAM-dependent methyltransferase [Chromohalobacter sp.]TDU24697.1 methyltransferase family protein [Chromohalobacter marismortui]
MNAAGSFSDAWLTRREQADHDARATAPLQAAIDWLAPGGDRAPWQLLDLGCGSGANVRYLAPRLPGLQHWHLVDHDDALLSHAVGRCQPLRDPTSMPIQVTTYQHDLHALESSWLADIDLVTASALCDLVSAAWVETLADACTAHRAAALITLSVDGNIRFQADDVVVNDAEDVWLFEILAAHQRRDKGFGPALGTTAPQALIDAFTVRGFHLSDAESPWRLTPAQRPLALSLIDGWAGAAREQAPQARRRIDRWWHRRRKALDQGHVDLYVGHRDVFAAPEPDHDPR